MKLEVIPISVMRSSLVYGLQPVVRCPGVTLSGSVKVTDCSSPPYFAPCALERDGTGRLSWDKLALDAEAVEAELTRRAPPHRCCLTDERGQVVPFELCVTDKLGLPCLGGRSAREDVQTVAYLMSALEKAASLPPRAAGESAPGYLPRLWEHLRGLGLEYDREEARRRPEGFPAELQFVRGGADVLDERKGNCLSLSLMLLLAWEAAGLDVALLTTRDHAMAVFFPNGLPKKWASDLAVISPEEVAKTVARGEATVVESTMLCGESLHWEAACMARLPETESLRVFPWRPIRRRFGIPAGLDSEAFSQAKLPLLRNLSAAVRDATRRGATAEADILLARAPDLLSSATARALGGWQAEPDVPGPELNVPLGFAATPEQLAVAKAFGAHSVTVADAAPGSGKSSLAVELAAAAARDGTVVLLAPDEAQRRRLAEILPLDVKPYALLPGSVDLHRVCEALSAQPDAAEAAFAGRSTTDGTALASGYFGEPLTPEGCALAAATLAVNSGPDIGEGSPLAAFRGDREAGFALAGLRARLLCDGRADTEATVSFVLRRILQVLNPFNLRTDVRRARSLPDSLGEGLPDPLKRVVLGWLRMQVDAKPGLTSVELCRLLDWAVLASVSGIACASAPGRHRSARRRLSPGTRAEGVRAERLARQRLRAADARARVAEGLARRRAAAAASLRGSRFERELCALVSAGKSSDGASVSVFLQRWAAELGALFPIVLALPGHGTMPLNPAAVVADEAGLLPLESLLPFLSRARRVAVLGDTHQLTINGNGGHSALAAALSYPARATAKLTLSLRGGGDAVFSWLSRTCYDGGLSYVPPTDAGDNRPLLMPTVSGAEAGHVGSCVINDAEACAVAESAVEDLSRGLSVMACSPNREQAALIARRVAQRAARSRIPTDRFRSLTTRQAQGHEADTVCISMTYVPRADGRLALGGDVLCQTAAALCVWISRARLGGRLSIFRSFGTAALPVAADAGAATDGAGMLRSLFAALEASERPAPQGSGELAAERYRELIRGWCGEAGFSGGEAGGGGLAHADLLFRDLPGGPLAVRIIACADAGCTDGGLAGDCLLERGGWRVLRLYAEDSPDVSKARLLAALAA